MQNVPCINVLDWGFVALTDSMGDDRVPAQVARTSFGNADAERTEEEDHKLGRYLMKHRHTTPFEFCQVRFYIRAPLFVVQQLLRHRTASVNQESLRYVTPTDPKFYIPERSRMVGRPANVKQGSSEEEIKSPDWARVVMDRAFNSAVQDYRTLIKMGLAPEIARAVMPTSLYTDLYYQIDLHNFLHFAGLRTDPHAQWETRQYAEAMLELTREHFPATVAAWEEGKNNG